MPHMETYLQCEQTELVYLKSKDKKLAQLIETVGPIIRETLPDPFQGLAHAIIGQQVSSKAQRSIWDKFTQLAGNVTPAAAAALSIQEIQKCGISLRKAGYISQIAELFVKGELSELELKQMSDDDLCATLVNIKGVGRWTAEMLLIFTFQRKNIISYGDLAIQRGLRMLYGHKTITQNLFERYKKRYQPYATSASLYLWELASGKYPQWKDRGKENKNA